MLLYCSKCYNGDDRIKSFIWDLITPPAELNKLPAGDVEGRMSNHMGLNNPVPRGRRRKKPTPATTPNADSTTSTPATTPANNSNNTAATATPAASLGGDEDSMTGEMNGSVATTTGAAATPAGGAAVTGASGAQGATPPVGDWLTLYDHHLLDEGYKRHLQRHANK